MRRRWLAVALVLSASASASADENLMPKDVLTVMVRRRVEIRKVCWEQSPAKADVAVKVDFTVAATGVVPDAKPSDASGPASIIACIVAEVKKTTFLASEKGGHFRWPFIFKGP